MKIKFNNKIIFETFRHYVLELDLENFDVQENELIVEQITKDNMNSVGSSIGNTTRKWIESDYAFVKGYCFRNEDNQIVGSFWMMLKGGDEKLYKVRNVDVFFFRLEVVESFRGKKYSKKIMNKMVQLARESGCKKAAYVTSTKNDIAINLYRSIGSKIVGKRFFIRVFGKNIPYYSI